MTHRAPGRSTVGESNRLFGQARPIDLDFAPEDIQQDPSRAFAGPLAKLAEKGDEFWVLDPDRHKGPLIAGTTN